MVTASVADVLRRGVLAIVWLGTAGICAELLLLEHFETVNQMIPLVLAALGLVVTLWTLLAPGMLAVRLLQFTMLLFIGAGIVGITLHAEATAARQADPAALEVIPPVLAPAIMIQLGLLGLLATYRHPAIPPLD